MKQFIDTMLNRLLDYQNRNPLEYKDLVKSIIHNSNNGLIAYIIENIDIKTTDNWIISLILADNKIGFNIVCCYSNISFESQISKITSAHYEFSNVRCNKDNEFIMNLPRNTKFIISKILGIEYNAFANQFVLANKDGLE